jgi:hypothetical protein
MMADDDKKKTKTLDEEIADDPYVKEGVILLQELIGFSG